jgi:tRNA threonylcarbamoyladenosine biosynthesis protein TsaE
MLVNSNSLLETQNLAKKLAKKYREGAVIALSGDLGAGKTSFVQGFAQGLGIKDKIISPTFVVIRQHQIQGSERLFHVDLYRLEGDLNINELGLKELFDDKSNLVLIEWPEKIAKDLPEETIYINFKKLSESEREITIKERQANN